MPALDPLARFRVGDQIKLIGANTVQDAAADLVGVQAGGDFRRRIGIEVGSAALAALGRETSSTLATVVLAGFALSGVAMAVARPWAVRHGTTLLRWIPPLLIPVAAGGYWGVVANPFNPLQLQNAATYAPQLWNIALYYAALLPFFFVSTGLRAYVEPDSPAFLGMLAAVTAATRGTTAVAC